MRPALNYLLIGLALAVLAAVAGLGVLREVIDQQATARAADRLERVPVVATDVRHDALERLQLRASILAGDPAFVGYVVQSLQPGAAKDGGIDRASILDLLKTRRSGYDVSAVLDLQGKPLVTDGPLPMTAGEQHNPLVMRALADLKPASGALVHDHALWWVTVSPLQRGGIAQGLLLTAARAGNGYATTISRHTGTAVAVLVGANRDYALASQHALPSWALQALPGLAASLPPPDALSVPDSEFRLPQANSGQVARVMPLSTSSGQALLVVMAEKPTTAVASWPALVLGLLAGCAVLWHWWWVERPLQSLADRIGSAARGHRPPQFTPHGAWPVRRLARNLNRLFEQRHSG